MSKIIDSYNFSPRSLATLVGGSLRLSQQELSNIVAFSTYFSLIPSILEVIGYIYLLDSIVSESGWIYGNLRFG